MKVRTSKIGEGNKGSGKQHCPSCSAFDWYYVVEQIGKDKKAYSYCYHCGEKIGDSQ